MPADCISRLLLFASICALREAKSLPEQGAFEVQIKVQVFDNSDLSPLADAQVDVHGNQTVLASSRAGSDGVLRVSFLYRTGTWVIITASKQDYITNSVPWHSSRIPLYASVSLYLLVQRPGTLILYDDVLQVLSGSPGARNQPLVQLQRKSLQLPFNSNYTALSAALTTARTQYEIGGFPFLLGQETNSSGWCLSQRSVWRMTEYKSVCGPRPAHRCEPELCHRQCWTSLMLNGNESLQQVQHLEETRRVERPHTFGHLMRIMFSVCTAWDTLTLIRRERLTGIQ